MFRSFLPFFLMLFSFSAVAMKKQCAVVSEKRVDVEEEEKDQEKDEGKEHRNRNQKRCQDGILKVVSDKELKDLVCHESLDHLLARQSSYAQPAVQEEKEFIFEGAIEEASLDHLSCSEELNQQFQASQSDSQSCPHSQVSLLEQPQDIPQKYSNLSRKRAGFSN